jgi:hypothetical protein
MNMTEMEKLLFTRTCALEILVEKLLSDNLRLSSDPIATGRAFIENIETSAVKNHNPALPTELAEMIHKAVVEIAERAIANIQKAKG